MVAAGLRVIAGGTIGVGIALLVTGAITGYLALRRLAEVVRTSGETNPGELRGPAFDYIVWTAIGLPVLLVVGILIAILTGISR
jgi:hypothetical protein